jgi:hypothetical protein
MEVEGGGLERVVAEVLLDEAQIDTGLEQVRGVAVAQGVDRDALSEAELPDHAPHGALHAGAGDGLGGGAGGLGVTPDGGEEPERIALGAPVVAQHVQRARRERDVAILRTFAAVDVDEPAAAVHVADLQVQALVQTKAEGVDGPEVGAVVWRAGRFDEAVGLLERENIGQGLRDADTQAREGLPLAGLGVAEEEADAVERHLDGGRSERCLVLEVEEVFAELGLGEPVGRAAKVAGELTDFAQVSLLRASAEAGDLEVLPHALTEGRGPDRGHERCLSQRRTKRVIPAKMLLCSRFRATLVGCVRQEVFKAVGEYQNCRAAAYLNDELKLSSRWTTGQRPETEREFLAVSRPDGPQLISRALGREHMVRSVEQGG